jgi:hypothetical protein
MHDIAKQPGGHLPAPDRANALSAARVNRPDCMLPRDQPVMRPRTAGSGRIAARLIAIGPVFVQTAAATTDAS